MKKKLVLFTFLLLLLSPIFTFTNAFASEEGLTINGGSYSSGSSYSPTSERLRIAFSSNWKVKEPGASSIVLNDMRSNKTIKKNEAALYLSGEALDARLINRNSSTSLLNEVEIRKKLTNGATSIIST